MARTLAALALLGAAPPPALPRSVGDAVRALAPGEYLWAGEVVPEGPVALWIDLTAQRLLVYRDGVPIAASTISSGARGRETPEGHFRILQKRRVHFSSRYDNAPMPFMQRLTWQGVALHGGHLPGYPASHGCIRLPRAFAERLFGVTVVGTPVVTSRARAPRLLAAGDRGTEGLASPAPRRRLTIVASEADARAVVLADGTRVAHLAVTIRPPLAQAMAYRRGPTRADWTVWTMPSRPAFVPSPGPWERLRLPDQDRALLDAAMAPGSTIVLVPDSLEAG